MPEPKKRGLVRMPSRRRPKPEEEEEDVTEAEVVEDQDEETEDEEESTPEPPKKRRRRATPPPEEDEDEDDSGDDEDEEEPPAPPAKKRRRRATPPEEDDAEEAPKRKPRAKKKASSKSTALAPAQKPMFGGIEGDMDSDDFEMPVFKLLHPMSPDFEETPAFAGKFVYNKEVSLGTSVEVILVRFQKKFKEVCEYDENALPEEFDTKSEAIAAGIKVRPCAVVDMLIPCDDETAPEALVTIDDEEFLMCRWYVSFGGYRKVAGPLMSHMSKGVDANISDRYYTLNVVSLPGKGKRKVAVLKPGEDETSEAIRAKIADLQTDAAE